MRKAFKWLPLFLMLANASAFAVVPAAWKHTAYAYDAKETTVNVTLQDFAKEFGMGLDMPPIDGVVDGHIRSQSPQEFLDRLGLEHHFQWFVYNETLYVSPSDQQTSARIEVSPDAVDDLKGALTDLGLLDPRFGWGALPDEGVVLVRGPAKYVDMIREHSKKSDAPAEKQDIIVLPLRYANAADRTIRYRDQEITVSGVASILQELLQSRSKGQSINGVNVLQGGGGVLGAGSSLDAGSSALGNMGNGSLEQGVDRVLSGGRSRSSRAGDSSSSRGKIRVSADVRNNSVLIYDLPKRRALYQSLIKQLDVPRNLIEIDAVILDIDRKELAELSSRWNFNSGSVSGGASLMDASSASTLFIKDAGKFSADLHALEGNGSASIISNPSILTLENQPAVIDLSRTEYLTATGERVANIEPITAGTSLQVIPRSLDHDGKSQVQLIVDIEDGQIDVSQINDTQPSVRRSNVSTQAVIAEHGSLVVGGFHAMEVNDTVSKIPLLGDIPWIGKLLFTSHKRDMSQRERLFILTPRLIGDQVNPARYVENGNPHDVDDAVKRIGARRDGAAMPTRGDIQQAFTQLADGVAPGGFRSSDTLPFVADTLCDPGLGVEMDRQRSQWYVQKDWGIAVVVARNTTSQPVRIDESSCGGRWSMGVSAWPHAWLQPGEESEVYIAMRQPEALKKGAQARTSLIKGAKP